MDHREQFRRAALAAGVADDEISRFLEHLRLSIRLGGVAGAPAGQFGGLPRLPANQQWPSHDGSRLPFVFSVDCAALPPVAGLPAGGSLLFFLDHVNDHLAAATGEQGHSRVLHVPAGAETAVADPGDAPVGKQYDLGASLAAELPGWFAGPGDDEDEDDLSPFQQQLAGDLERDLPHLDELRAVADELWPPDLGLASAYLGGYADDEVVSSIAEQTLAEREPGIPPGRWYSRVEQEAHRLAGEWMSLARFPADDQYYYGSFVIRRDDLAAGRLDRAYSITDFSE